MNANGRKYPEITSPNKAFFSYLMIFPRKFLKNLKLKEINFMTRPVLPLRDRTSTLEISIANLPRENRSIVGSEIEENMEKKRPIKKELRTEIGQSISNDIKMKRIR